VALAQQVGVEPAWLVGPEQTERGREMFLGCDRIAQLD
jgi:hypothetical protein